MRKKLGLIVNPVAGLGGRVGLKGSDGLDIQRRALALGAQPEAQRRAAEAVARLQAVRAEVELFTYPGEMGAEAAAAAGFTPVVLGSIRPGETTAEDTRRAVQEMAGLDVSLLLFAGGDGTARDVCQAVGQAVPSLGIPAGVKIHSAVYAASPRSAGDLARLLVQGEVGEFREAEVMDLDEGAIRRGVVAARLYGYLRVPYRRALVQSLKSATPPGEAQALREIALAVIGQMRPGRLYITGPGTTTRAVHAGLGLAKTLIGVDVILDRQLALADASEAQLLSLLEAREASVIVTPIGGQGFLLGRGNPQISPAVLRRVGRESLMVIGTVEKLAALRGRPFLVDTGSAEVDQALSGHVRVLTGRGKYAVYRVQAPGLGSSDGYRDFR